MGLIDLHTHSNASDGSFTPRELVAYAQRRGAAALALTDHDTLAGLEEALQAGTEFGLEIIPGLEISAQYAGGTMHILGYLFNRADPNLNRELLILQQARRERNPKIIKKLQGYGIPITQEQIAALAPGQIGRPHIAQALLQLKAVSSLEEAFQKYLRKGALAYVEKFRFPPKKAISLIRRAGGIAVLAHPFTLSTGSIQELRALILGLKEEGLKGLEVYYSEHTSEQTRQYRDLAEEMGLLCTGGTDFHGANKEKVDLLSGYGDLKIPYELLQKLKAQAGWGASRG